jgi:hypothetical protein
MAIGSGMAAQLGVVAETTWGQAVTVTRFYPLVNESISQDIERLESEGIIAGARVLRSSQWDPGDISVGGDVGLELYQQFAALLFEHMFGTISSSATAGIATHTVTPGDLTGKSLTVQVGRPMVTGTVIPYTYSGVKIASWELSVATGENATLGLTLIGKDETDGIALATASFGTDAASPFSYVQGTVSISSTDVCIRELTLSGDNQLSDERRCLGARVIREPLEMALRDYTGTATLEFANTTQYGYFVNSSEASIVLSFSASTSARLAITMNARFDGVTPNVEGRDLLVMEVPFKAVATSTDSDAIRAVITNSQTSP